MNVNTFNKCRDLISMNSQQNERLKHKCSINTWKLNNLVENKKKSVKIESEKSLFIFCIDKRFS